MWKVLTTGGSLLGCGGVLDALSVQGTWSSEEARLSINILALRVVWLSFQCCKPSNGKSTQREYSWTMPWLIAYINNQAAEVLSLNKIRPDHVWEQNCMFQSCPPFPSQAWKIGREIFSAVGIWIQVNGLSIQRYFRPIATNGGSLDVDFLVSRFKQKNGQGYF